MAQALDQVQVPSEVPAMKAASVLEVPVVEPYLQVDLVEVLEVAFVHQVQVPSKVK